MAFLICLAGCGGGGGGGGSGSGLASSQGGGASEGGDNVGSGGSGSSFYGDGLFEVSRGPFGGDRTSIVIDPTDPDRAVANSCDFSGIWITENGGDLWGSCNPAGAPFEKECTVVALIGADGEQPAEILVAVTSEHELDGAFYKIALTDPAKSATEMLPGGKSRVRCLAAAPAPSRPGRIAAVSYSLSQLLELQQGNVVFTADRGATWCRWFAGGRFHIPLAVSFNHGGDKLLLASAGSIDLADLRLFYDEEGPGAIMEMIKRLEEDLPIDAGWVLRYNIDTNPTVQVVNPADGTLLSPGVLLSGYRVETIALDPGVADVIWFCHKEGLARSGDDASTVLAVDTYIEEAQGPIPAPLKAMGLSVLPDPGDGEETLFLCLGGGWGRKRGIFKLVYDESLFAWRAEQVSPGASRSFLDYPKGPVCAAPSKKQVLYAPYCQDAILVSEEFGDGGTWTVAMEGMTGFNVFGVTEDPFDPNVVMCTGQNLIRRSESRLSDSEWSTCVIQVDQVAANLRAGVIVDPADRNRWLVAGGGGASVNLNGGVWLTKDGGANWTRVLGNDATPTVNPQIFAMLQHPVEPNLVVVAGRQWLESGTPGVWASLQRGEAGTFTHVLNDGQYRAITAVDIAGVGSTLVGGEGGLALLCVEEGAVAVEKVPWNGGLISALASASGYVYAGTAAGNLCCVDLTEMGDEQAWRLLGGFPSAVASLALSEQRPGEIYVGTAEDGIYSSTDGGVTFASFDAGLESSERATFCLLISSLGDRLYAGTLGGLAVRRLD